MAFHEVQFPDTISYGSSGGPGFKTNIHVVDSGAEQRVGRWNQARRRYNARYGIKSLDQLTALMAFYIARRGPLHGFRWKDWTDYTTAANHRDASAFDDQVIAIHDGVTQHYQMVKRYTSGGVTRVRNITKPVDGTFTLGIEGIEQVGGFSINPSTGIVTLNIGGLSGGETITGGCEFDVPVRFGAEIDELLGISIDDFDQGNVPDVPVVEIIDNLEIEDEFFYGGAPSAPITFDSDITISPLQGRVIPLAPQLASLRVYLPDFSSLPPGGPWFWFPNLGPQDVSLHSSGGALIANVLVGVTAAVILGTDDQGKRWFAYG